MNAPRAGIPLRPDPSALHFAERRSVMRACAAVAYAARDKNLDPVEVVRKAWPETAPQTS